MLSSNLKANWKIYEVLSLNVIKHCFPSLNWLRHMDEVYTFKSKADNKIIKAIFGSPMLIVVLWGDSTVNLH